MRSEEFTQIKQNKKSRTQLQWWSPNSSQPSQTTNESVEYLDVGSRHRIQILKETADKGPQPQFTKDWEVTEEVLENLQLFLTISSH